MRLAALFATSQAYREVAMRSYRVPTRRDVWRLVESHGSIDQVATALGVSLEEMENWLGGTKPIPVEHYAALRALLLKLRDKKG
jgi:hypothetical protein